MKHKYFFTALILFIVLTIPYFQNMDPAVMKFFFIEAEGLNDLYFILIFIGMIEGITIYFAIQEFVRNAKTKEIDKFDLGQ